MHALIFQSQDMINLCFYFNESPPTYAYKRYAYIKIECIILTLLTRNLIIYN